MSLQEWQTAWGKLQWPLTEFWRFVFLGRGRGWFGHLHCSKSMFLYPQTPLWQDASQRNCTQCQVLPQAFHSNTTALSMSKSSSLPTGQAMVSQAARSQAKHHKPVNGFAKFLLGEVCFLQGYGSEMHWRRPQSTASNQSCCYFSFPQLR